jgi:hypothetical protein
VFYQCTVCACGGAQTIVHRIMSKVFSTTVLPGWLVGLKPLIVGFWVVFYHSADRASGVILRILFSVLPLCYRGQSWDSTSLLCIKRYSTTVLLGPVMRFLGLWVVFYHCATKSSGGIKTLLDLRISCSVLPLCCQDQWWDSTPLNLGLWVKCSSTVLAWPTVGFIRTI